MTNNCEGTADDLYICADGTAKCMLCEEIVPRDQLLALAGDELAGMIALFFDETVKNQFGIDLDKDEEDQMLRDMLDD